MRLIEGFAIVRVSAAAHFLAPANFHFAKPIGIGQGLAGHADDVRIAILQDCFGLIEGGNAARRDHRCVESSFINRVLDMPDERHAAAKRSAFIGQSRRHALVTTLSCVRIDGLAHLRLFGVFELSAFRDGKIIETSARKFNSEVNGRIDAIAVRDHFIAEETHADEVIIADFLSHGPINFQRQARAILPRSAAASAKIAGSTSGNSLI